jgi:hypothetical protein
MSLNQAIKRACLLKTSKLILEMKFAWHTPPPSPRQTVQVFDIFCLAQLRILFWGGVGENVKVALAVKETIFALDR